MAYGDGEDDARLLSEWRQFCDRLKSAGELVFKDANPPTPVHRADGFRHLTQNLGQAFALALETRDTRYPQLFAFSHPNLHLASDNADCTYIQAWIDGQSVYKVSGTKGSARFWAIAVQGARSVEAYGKGASRPLHEPFGDIPEASIFGHELVTNWDGSFELYIGGEKQGQNWLPTTPSTRKLFLRQYFDAWEDESAQYRIERVGMVTPRPMPMPDEVIAAMRWASDFVYDVVDFWPDWPHETGSGGDLNNPNRFDATRELDGSTTLEQRRGRSVGQMRWEVGSDEALVLEFDDPGSFWMLTCENPFCASMDFLYRNVSYTPSRTALDADGRIRLVLSARDPGFANWIDTEGFVAGMLTLRNIHAAHLPAVETRLVPFAEVEQAMHPSSLRITEAERTRELKRRFDAIRRRYRL